MADSRDKMDRRSWEMHVGRSQDGEKKVGERDWEEGGCGGVRTCLEPPVGPVVLEICGAEAGGALGDGDLEGGVEVAEIGVGHAVGLAPDDVGVREAVQQHDHGTLPRALHLHAQAIHGKEEGLLFHALSLKLS